MRYLFRLTFQHQQRGYLHFDEPAKSFELHEGLTLELRARDADTLSQACRYHIEGSGFESKGAARSAGERLRLRLRLLNGALSLGFTIPSDDQTSSQTSDEINKKGQEFGVNIVDSVFGLSVFPDDGKHCELVWHPSLEALPSNPFFLFEAISEIWPMEMEFGKREEDAIEILGRASTEKSPRAKFLMTYLAVERVLERSERSAAAQSLIKKFQKTVYQSGLDEKEVKSLQGALSNLKIESMKSALDSLANRIITPKKIQGKEIKFFVADCVSARNELTHDIDVSSGTDLQALSDGLREFVMNYIWTSHELPSFTVKIPASSLSFNESSFRII